MTRDLIGGIVRNQFDLQHLSNGLSKDVADSLRALFDEIAAELVRIDPTASCRA